jgi:hypothetical protein
MPISTAYAQNGDMTLDIKSKSAEMQVEWKKLHIPATDRMSPYTIFTSIGCVVPVRLLSPNEL